MASVAWARASSSIREKNAPFSGPVVDFEDQTMHHFIKLKSLGKGATSIGQPNTQNNAISRVTPGMGVPTLRASLYCFLIACRRVGGEKRYFTTLSYPLE